MHLADDWFISFATSVLCMLITSVATQEAWFSEKDVVLRTIESKRTTAKSVGHCAFRCLLDVECQAYQYSAHEQQNCALLHRNSTQDGTTLVSHQNSKLYEKVVHEENKEPSGHNWSFPPGWNSGHFPAVHHSFDHNDTGNFQLENGAQIVAGKVNNAIRTDLDHKQWVSLGNLSGVACLAIPDSCGSEGGALSVWIKILNCSDNTGIISSYQESQGFQIACFRDSINYGIALPTNSTGAMTSIPVEWFHLVLNYLGPEQGFTIHHNGEEKVNASQTFSSDLPSGPGIVVIGRYSPLTDDSYASLMMDELMFFNRKLSLEEILFLYNLHN